MGNPVLVAPNWNWRFARNKCRVCEIIIREYVEAQLEKGIEPRVWSTGKKRYYCNECKEDVFGGVKRRNGM